MLPQRPRNHQLDNESRLEFQGKLPSQWLFENVPPPEYGLDGRVEIFDKSDLATGLMFFVQLKGTDESNLQKALAVKLQLSTCEYYWSLDLPVLIVRYHAPTRKLYVRWFHTYDPYYGRNAKKEITFRLSLEDEWQDETADQLVSDLEKFRQLRSPRLTLPVKFTLTLKEQYIHGVLDLQVELAIRKAIENLSGVITISKVLPKNAHGSIVIGNEKTEIFIASGTGFTLHTSKIKKTEFTISKFAYDILVGIAIALENAGHSNIAARILAQSAFNSSIIIEPQIMLIVVNCMIQAHRVIEALELSERLFENQEFILAAEMLVLPALSQRNYLSESQHKYLENFLDRYTEGIAQTGNRQKIASAHYNLGNYFKSRAKQRLAIHHYRKAIKSESEYLAKPYFCRELAGVLFESKRYYLAVKLYERALSLGEEGVCRALYADALMFVGKYYESQEVFYAYLSSSAKPESEWRLKACVLVWIYSMLGCKEQKRQSETAIQLTTPDDNLSSQQYKQKLEAALSYDALCDNAWFNLGVLESQNGNQDSAFISFLIAALINTGHVEAWCNAIAIGIFRSYDSLVSDIIQAAYHYSGSNLMEQLIIFAESQDESFPFTDFLKEIDEIISNISQEEQPFTVRLLAEGADFYPFHLGVKN